MKTVKTLTCVAIVAISLAIALPAGAHTAGVSGTATCSDGSHVVTWSITDDLAKQAMNVTATVAVGSTTYDVSGLTNPIAGGATATATTTVPGDVTGDVVLTVDATWLDGFTRTETASVTLTEKCTATTTTGAPTTTAPTTTVPQSVEGVSTLAVPTTTTPTGVEAAQCSPSTLACTGSDTGTPVAVGFGLLIAGAGLIALKRRPSPTR